MATARAVARAATEMFAAEIRMSDARSNLELASDAFTCAEQAHREAKDVFDTATAILVANERSKRRK
jgi:hypothetical protein